MATQFRISTIQNLSEMDDRRTRALDPRLYFVLRKMYERREHMSDPRKDKTYSVEEAVRAQKALRELAKLGPEMFPVQAFVGMISDEVETLRGQGHSDETIAQTIKAHSSIDITAEEIAAHYASPEDRHPTHG
jgi:hypothetical protein